MLTQTLCLVLLSSVCSQQPCLNCAQGPARYVVNVPLIPMQGVSSATQPVPCCNSPNSQQSVVYFGAVNRNGQQQQSVAFSNFTTNNAQQPPVNYQYPLGQQTAPPQGEGTYMNPSNSPGYSSTPVNPSSNPIIQVTPASNPQSNMYPQSTQQPFQYQEGSSQFPSQGGGTTYPQGGPTTMQPQGQYVTPQGQSINGGYYPNQGSASPTTANPYPPYQSNQQGITQQGQYPENAQTGENPPPFVPSGNQPYNSGQSGGYNSANAGYGNGETLNFGPYQGQQEPGVQSGNFGQGQVPSQQGTQYGPPPYSGQFQDQASTVPYSGSSNFNGNQQGQFQGSTGMPTLEYNSGNPFVYSTTPQPFPQQSPSTQNVPQQSSVGSSQQFPYATSPMYSSSTQAPYQNQPSTTQVFPPSPSDPRESTQYQGQQQQPGGGPGTMMAQSPQPFSSTNGFVPSSTYNPSTSPYSSSTAAPFYGSTVQPQQNPQSQQQFTTAQPLYQNAQPTNDQQFQGQGQYGSQTTFPGNQPSSQYGQTSSGAFVPSNPSNPPNEYSNFGSTLAPQGQYAGPNPGSTGMPNYSPQYDVEHNMNTVYGHYNNSGTDGIQRDQTLNIPTTTASQGFHLLVTMVLVYLTF